MKKYTHSSNKDIYYVSKSYIGNSTVTVKRPDGYRSKITLSPHNLKQFENTLREKGFISA